MCSRSIRAHFTAGPKAATFSIDFSTESDEGAEEIVVESGLFSYDSPQGGRSVKVKDDEISEFLQEAGLYEAITEHVEEEDEPSERRRWVYGDVIHDAI